MIGEIGERPWGKYEVLAERDGYKVKRITVVPGGRLSLQSHQHRAEHWVVVMGTATVTVDEAVLTVAATEHVHIPLQAKHRLENHTDLPVVLIEVQTGNYLGEDDIVRYDDIYGRS
ncbi:mannose-6-phosphate isomerase [SAR116 cluster alpha proteobacterium HIMB100]|nr:mannose-6-phosphate isomerase [SAR116 cluster alpha proteobacterium HIMB100]